MKKKSPTSAFNRAAKIFRQGVSGIALMAAAAVGVVAPTDAEAQQGLSQAQYEQLYRQQAAAGMVPGSPGYQAPVASAPVAPAAPVAGGPEYDYQIGLQILQTRLQERFSRCMERAASSDGRHAYRGTQILGRSAQGAGRVIDRIDGRNGDVRAGDLASGLNVLLGTLGSSAQHGGYGNSTDLRTQQCQLDVREEAFRGQQRLQRDLDRARQREQREAQRAVRGSGQAVVVPSSQFSAPPTPLSDADQAACDTLKSNLIAGKVRRATPAQQQLCNLPR